jgi:hypothetical protein
MQSSLCGTACGPAVMLLRRHAKTAGADEDMLIAALRLGSVMFTECGALAYTNVGLARLLDGSRVDVPNALDSTYAPPTATLRTVSCNSVTVMND